MSERSPAGPASATERARAAALAAARVRPGAATTVVTYRSEGRVLVIGAEAPALAAAAALGEGVRCTVLVPLDPASDDAGWSTAADAAATTAPPPAGTARPRILRAPVLAVTGHLGDFRVRSLAPDGSEVDLAPSLVTGHRPFDLVLDLHDPPFVGAEVPPPGYRAAAEPGALERALAELPGLVGEFEKPSYLAYDPDACAHGRSGIGGCTRCLDACPTGAIASLRERVEIDGHLCQGGGSCATVCPTGAITYAYPAPADLLEALRSALAAYRESAASEPGGEPVAPAAILFHDAEAGAAWLERHRGVLPAHVLPWPVEEAGSVGLDAWLALLAYGAGRVIVGCPPDLPGAARSALDSELEVARALLPALGIAPGAIGRLALGAGPPAPEAFAALEEASGRLAAPATFRPAPEKRTTVRLALDHLWRAAAEPAAEVALPAGAAFGAIRVDRERCTLCMACASVCPAGAIAAGGDVPVLRYVEWSCVQCGVCERACPEGAIRREPRMILDPERRGRAETLHEDRPFACVACGKVYATERIVARMRERLASHWMFQKPEARRRLEMCEDCRVKDMFRDGGGLLDVDGPRRH